MVSVSVFCPTCGRYIGAASHCIECGQERPFSHHLPCPNTPTWHIPVADKPHNQSLAHQGGLYLADYGKDEQGNRRGQVMALQTNTGQVAWHTSLEAAPRSQMATDDRFLYLSVGRELLALATADGRVSHRWPVSGTAGSPLIVGDTLYLGDAEGHLHALRSGQQGDGHLWTAVIGQRVDNAPAHWRYLLLVATRHANGHLVALDRRNGQEMWREPLRDRALPPVVAGSLVLVAMQQGQLLALDLERREQAWRYAGREQLLTGPVTAGQQVFIGDVSGRVTAVDLSTGHLLWQKELGQGSITGLACGQGLLFAGTYQGGLLALDGRSGESAWQWADGGRISAGPVVVDGVVYGGGATAGWFALPWHLGQWTWAAGWSERAGQMEATAAFYALSGKPEKASQLWLAHGQARLAAQLWLALGDDARAATAFRQAAEQEQATYPARASGAWMRAAHHYDAAGQEAPAAECRRRAGRMGRFAYLEIHPFNLPQFEAGLPGQVGFRLRNWGLDAARRIRFDLGGQLQQVIRAEFEGLAAGETAVVTIENLISTRVGEQELIVALAYDGGGHTGDPTLHKWLFHVVPPPPGLIQVGDAGGVIVRTVAGQPLPTVRGENIGWVRYEVKTA